MLKRREIREMSTEDIIATIFYMGVGMVNKSTKAQEKELSWYCEELALRGIVHDGKKLYEKMCQ